MKPIAELDIFYEPPAEVRPHKVANYTITPIGGPAEYKLYLEDKAKRMAARALAKKEAYDIRRLILGEIVLGKKSASPDAMKIPQTLDRYRWEMGAPCANNHVSHLAVEFPATPPPSSSPNTTWRDRVRKLFRR